MIKKNDMCGVLSCQFLSANFISQSVMVGKRVQECQIDCQCELYYITVIKECKFLCTCNRKLKPCR